MRPQGDALMIRYMAAVPLLLAAMSAQNVPSTNKGRHLDIPAISREANGSIVSIVMSNKDGHPLAQGSGFLISKDGQVVTNYHVIKSGTSAVVKLPDGAFFPVDGVLTSDKGRDVAIIKAHGNDSHTLTLGDSDRLQVGEEVVAIGSPLSLESTVSTALSALSELSRTKGANSCRSQRLYPPAAAAARCSTWQEKWSAPWPGLGRDDVTSRPRRGDRIRSPGRKNRHDGLIDVTAVSGFLLPLNCRGEK